MTKEQVEKLSEVEADITTELRLLVFAMREAGFEEEFVVDSLNLMVKLALSSNDVIRTMVQEARERLERVEK